MSLTLSALRLLVAANPYQACQPLATALLEVRQQRGESAEQKLFEAVLEGLGPESKFLLREMFPGRSRWGSGTDLRRIAFPLWQAFYRKDREDLRKSDLKQALRDLGYQTEVEDYLGRCVKEGLLDAYSDRCRINSSLMGRWLETPPLLLP